MVSLPKSLPAVADEILAGKIIALSIADQLNAAFWLHGRDNGAASVLLQRAHDGLTDLADAMGYTIVPKVDA